MIILYFLLISRLSDIVQFGELEPPTELPTYQENRVDFLKLDQQFPDSFLFNVGGALVRYSTDGGQTVVAGNVTAFGLVNGPALRARFSKYFLILQFNRTRIAIIDYRHHCIRELDTTTKIVQPFIGECNTKVSQPDHHITLTRSDQNLSVTDSFLRYPVGAVYLHSRSLIVVSDLSLARLVKVDLNTKTASLLCSRCDESVLPWSRDLVSDTNEKYIYVSHTAGLSKIDVDTYEVKLLVGIEDGKKAQHPNSPHPFEYVQGGSILHTLHWLIPNKVLVSYAFGGIRGPFYGIALIDLMNEDIEYICNSEFTKNIAITSLYQHFPIGAIILMAG